MIPVAGIGEVAPGTDLARLIADAARAGRPDGPRPARRRRGRRHPEDRVQGRRQAGGRSTTAIRRPKLALVEQESVRVLRRRGELVISETRHGFVCANAGVDLSNVADGTAALLPEDSDRSARRIRAGLQRALGRRGRRDRLRHIRPAWRRGRHRRRHRVCRGGRRRRPEGHPRCRWPRAGGHRGLRGRRAGLGGRARHGQGPRRPGRPSCAACPRSGCARPRSRPRSSGRPTKTSSAEPSVAAGPHELEHGPGAVGQLGPGAPAELDRRPLDVEARAQQLTRVAAAP